MSLRWYRGDDGKGGAVFTHDVVTKLTNCTVYDNNAYYGGAIYNDRGAREIMNSILRSNTAVSQGTNVFQAAASCHLEIRYSDIQGHQSSIRRYYNGGYPMDTLDYANNINVNPDFANPASGGKINMGAYGNTFEASKVDAAKLATLGATILPTNVLSLAGWRLSYEASDVWHNPSNVSSSDYWWRGLVPGDYTVVFKPVSGWITPSPFEACAGAGSQGSAFGQYQQP